MKSRYAASVVVSPIIKRTLQILAKSGRETAQPKTGFDFIQQTERGHRLFPRRQPNR